MNKKYTIKDIALLAGVSKGTVDRVLHKRGKVSDTALKKVTAILETIDYKPNLIAQNLKNNKTYHICVLLPDPNIDNYWQRCKIGILNASQDFEPFNVIVSIIEFNPQFTESFVENHQKALKQNPDAVLLAPLFYKEAQTAITDYKNLNIPVLTFNNQVTPITADGFVGQDLIQSGRVAARLFETTIRSGHITIIHINEDISNAKHMQEKESGFRTYFESKEENAFKISTLHVEADKLHALLTNYLENNTDTKGLFITTSKSYLVAETLEALRINDITLVGYDLLDLNVKYLNSGHITYLINQNPKHQAHLGVTSLAEHLIYQNKISKTTYLPLDIINSENVKQYITN
ncbi:substrate-binding domain-containing protein [Formosa sediminum]|uniref:Substrate-binding domain-containing protein n=1 Tax=Formosa sediminum TaxID=2594004 RepID=A0A516GUZ5_9FLAO|nr:substrate-binding domain-containing protein [Formosa sediminum]QDO95210.1 substrate-binding domain-containing protein [Formosa sediminum]